MLVRVCHQLCVGNIGTDGSAQRRVCCPITPSGAALSGLHGFSSKQARRADSLQYRRNGLLFRGFLLSVADVVVYQGLTDDWGTGQMRILAFVSVSTLVRLGVRGSPSRMRVSAGCTTQALLPSSALGHSPPRGAGVFDSSRRDDPFGEGGKIVARPRMYVPRVTRKSIEYWLPTIASHPRIFNLEHTVVLPMPMPGLLLRHAPVGY